MDDHTRFEQVFREHVDAVRAYVNRRDAALADEVVSETFFVLWRRLDDLPEEPLPWLLGVARRVLANSRRARDRREALARRVSALPEPHDHEPEVDPRVSVALGQLKPADREILLLIAWDGLDRGEVAKVLGCTPSAVAVRLHRARKRFEMAYRASARQVPTARPDADNGVSHV